MQVDKRGRPPRDDGEVKNKQYRLRLSDSKAEILRRGLRMQHNLLRHTG